MTIKPAIERRLAVPCTPSELAVLLRLSRKVVKCHLYQMRARGRVKRLDRRLPPAHKTGPGEYLWQRT